MEITDFISVSTLKYASQILILVAGVWALFTDSTKKDEATGKRRLTGVGFAKIAILGLAFAIFILSDLADRRSSEHKIAEQAEELAFREQTIASQAQQLSFLQEIILRQQGLSDVVFGWRLTGDGVRAFTAELQKPEYADSDAVYIDAALRGGHLRSYRTSEGWVLEVTANRPQGLYDRRFDERSVEWRAFNRGITALVSRRFEIALATGTGIIDFGSRDWPTEFQSDRGAMQFTVRPPGISLGELLDGKLVLWLENRTNLPEAYIRTNDPRLSWNQTLSFDLAPVTVREIVTPEFDEPLKQINWRSQPINIDAALTFSLD